MIKYHDNKNGIQYENGKLTNNWNPDGNYKENEYISVHFRIECKAYDSMAGYVNNGSEQQFNNEKMRIFQKLGWFIDNQDFNGCCMDVSKGDARLYLHPQDFSGIVRKKDVKAIAEALENNKTFSIRWVDLYETVYTMTDDEYQAYLESRTDDVRKILYNGCKTSRTYKYCYLSDVVFRVANKIHLPLIGCRNVHEANQQTRDFVSGVVDTMVKDGYLKIGIGSNHETFVRSLNKTEMKQAKLKAIA